ncbi:hypothetical protein H0H87_012556 [Tephrocybe sp. NHM501043]|nr:hypothetical protein H0H87_012556 [Tephrocybe sp. NHM501043]
MTLPVAETQLCEHLGDRYDDKDWRPALNTEGDAVEAQDAIQTLAAASQLPKLTIKLPGRHASNPQIEATETALMESVNELVKRNRIFGNPPTLEELLNPAEERDDPDSLYTFDGGDDEIVAQVRREMAEKSGGDDIIEIDDSGDEESDHEDDCSAELITLCATLERQCLKHGDSELSLELPRQLRVFRAQLLRKQNLAKQQTTIDKFFT